MMKLIAFVLGFCGAGCAAPVGVRGPIYVPKDAAQTCASYCGEIGMALNSVVIMASNVGCVCSASPAESGAGASSGGMAALMMDAEERHQSQRNSSSPRSPR